MKMNILYILLLYFITMCMWHGTEMREVRPPCCRFGCSGGGSCPGSASGGPAPGPAPNPTPAPEPTPPKKGGDATKQPPKNGGDATKKPPKKGGDATKQPPKIDDKKPKGNPFSLDQYRLYDYCKLDSHCYYKKHTACSNKPKEQLFKDCVPVDISKYRSLIVALHNKFRDDIACGRIKNQPKASNMRRMKWDLELEYLSFFNAEYCNLAYQKRCHATERFYAGSNVLKAYSERGAIDEMVKQWFNQHNNLKDQKFVNKYVSNRKTDFYAQAAWAETWLIGCSMGVTFLRVYYLACDYGPSYDDHKPIYYIGAPTTRCPSGSGKDTFYKGLCSVKSAFSRAAGGDAAGAAEADASSSSPSLSSFSLRWLFKPFSAAVELISW